MFSVSDFHFSLMEVVEDALWVWMLSLMARACNASQSEALIISCPLVSNVFPNAGLGLAVMIKYGILI